MNRNWGCNFGRESNRAVRISTNVFLELSGNLWLVLITNLDRKPATAIKYYLAQLLQVWYLLEALKPSNTVKCNYWVLRKDVRNLSWNWVAEKLLILLQLKGGNYIWKDESTKITLISFWYFTFICVGVSMFSTKILLKWIDTQMFIHKSLKIRFWPIFNLIVAFYKFFGSWVKRVLIHVKSDQVRSDKVVSKFKSGHVKVIFCDKHLSRRYMLG